MILNPISGKPLASKQFWSTDGTPESFPHGSSGPHGGIHLNFSPSDDTPVFACAAGILIRSIHYESSTSPDEYINDVLVFQHDLEWPGEHSPQFFCLWAAKHLHSVTKQKFLRGDLICTLKGLVHWELFWEQVEHPFPNPLRTWLDLPSWGANEPQGQANLCEWDGPQSWMQGHTKEATRSFQNAAKRQRWWDLDFASSKARYSHPGQTLQQLQKLESFLPHFLEGSCLEIKHWNDFRLLMSMVEKALGALRTNAQSTLCFALGQAFLSRKYAADWAHCHGLADLCKDHYGELLSSIPWAEIPASNHLSAAQTQAVLQAYLATQACVQPLFHLAQETLAQQAWNPYALTNPTQVNDFVFYGLKSADSLSALHPSLFIHTSAAFAEPGQSLSVQLSCGASRQSEQTLTHIQWTFLLDGKATAQAVGLQASFFVQARESAHRLGIQVCTQHCGAHLGQQRNLEIHYGACLQLNATLTHLQIPWILNSNAGIPLDSVLRNLPHSLQGFYTLQAFQANTESLAFFDSQGTPFLTLAREIPLNANASIFAPTTEAQCWCRNREDWPRLLQYIADEQVTRIYIKSSEEPTHHVAVMPPSPPLHTNVECCAKLLQLGYWCDQLQQEAPRALQHAWHTFQTEMGIPVTGQADSTSCTVLAQTNTRPGLPVHAQLYHRGKKTSILHTRFFQLCAPTLGEFVRYGDTIAVPADSNDQGLRGILHNDLWGIAAMVNALRKLLVEWHWETNDCMQVGDLSLWCGGLFREHHSHQQGTSADCRSFRVGAMQIMGKRNPHYHIDETEQFCRRAHALGFGIIYTSCPQLLARLGPHSHSPMVTPMAGHEHHLHLEFTIRS